MERYILIIYEININETAFKGLSLHVIDKGEDMFVFAHNLMLKTDTELMYGSFFFGETAYVRITDVQAISKDIFETLSELLKQH